MSVALRLAWLALASTASAATTTGTRQCVDPCIQAARGAFRQCTSSAAGAFLEALGGCLERNPGCLSACRDQRHDCRDATSLGVDLAACEAELGGAMARCRDRFPRGSIQRAICVYRARAKASRCRRRAVVRAGVAVKRCQSAFVDCTRSCAPDVPPGGSGSCRAAARSDFAASRVVCRTSFRVTTGGCLGKDVTCVQDCIDLRDACDAAARPMLDDAIAVCKAARNAGLTDCQAANPDGGDGLDACQETVRANALACRQAAVEAALPGFRACATAYAVCVRACPPA